MRPIAMRCTQEQFDSIKDRITLPIAEDVFRYSGLVQSYLTNDYNSVGEVKYTISPVLANREIIETFDANIFLEACDIEVEKVFTLQDFQYRTKGSLKWTDYRFSDGTLEYRLKPQFNSANYQKEIEALQQKAKENGMNVIINFEKI